jgi:glycosyltransferase involved in cell wall biosynthesis
MRVALVAPPFLPVPPVRYGGTELFISHLARGLVERGHQVTVYANGESRLPAGMQLRSIYPASEWPLDRPAEAGVKELAHTAWACDDAAGACDVIHVNGVSGVILSRFLDVPVVATLHHAKDETISQVFTQYPDVTYVGISRAQLEKESLARSMVVHHGIDLDCYPLEVQKDDYLVFLGRITPEKAPHVAVEVARRAGRRLVIAGEIQPMYQEYWERAVKPLVDGRDVQYVGEADLAAKTALLGHASAMLFPIEWDEPFGLVMLEAMACGTPVLAFGRGSVPEVVEDGVSGWVCRDIKDMARRAIDPDVSPHSCRRHVASRFTIDRMAASYERAYRSAVAAAAAKTPAKSVASGAIPVVPVPPVLHPQPPRPSAHSSGSAEA